jgi:hypothetical protein
MASAGRDATCKLSLKGDAAAGEAAANVAQLKRKGLQEGHLLRDLLDVLDRKEVPQHTLNNNKLQRNSTGLTQPGVTEAIQEAALSGTYWCWANTQQLGTPPPSDITTQSHTTAGWQDTHPISGPPAHRTSCYACYWRYISSP